MKIRQRFSNFQTISCGSPQGNVLGLLFSLYIKNLHISSAKVKLLFLVVETCLLHSSKDINILQNDLHDSLNNIARANKLTLNIDKSRLKGNKRNFQKLK